MTVQVESPTVEYVGNGATGPYAFSFRANVFSDIDAYLDGVKQPSNTYSVDLNADQDVSPGGNVFFNAPINAPTVITIRRTTELDQQTDYRPFDPFPAESHEDALDKLTMISQDQQLDIDRSLKASVNDDGTTDYTLPPYDAGKALAWDDVTKSLANSDDKINDIITDAKDSADAAAISASNAAGSASGAATSASNASISESNAVTSETNAADSETNAASSESNAATSETNAAISESNALASENKANLWAEEAENVPVEPGEFSAFHWAKKAENLVGGTGDASQVTFDDTNTFVKGTNVQVFNQALDIKVNDNAIAVSDTVNKSGDTMSGDLTISKSTPDLTLNGGSGSDNLLLSLRKNNVLRALFAWVPFSDSFFIRRYLGDGSTIAAEIELTNDNKVNISQGTFQLDGQDIDDRFLRKDVDDEAIGDLTINKLGARLTLNDPGSSGSILDFQVNKVLRSIILHDTPNDILLIRQYLPNGTTVIAELSLSADGNVDVSVGNFQINGVAIDDLFLPKDVDFSTAGDIAITKTAPFLLLSATGSTDAILELRSQGVREFQLNLDALTDTVAISKYDAGSGINLLAEIELTETGKVNISKGDFQIAGQDVQFQNYIALGYYEENILMWGYGLTLFKGITGFYEFDFTTPQPDINFAIFIQAKADINSIENKIYYVVSGFSVTGFGLECYDETGAFADANFYFKVER